MLKLAVLYIEAASITKDIRACVKAGREEKWPSVTH